MAFNTDEFNALIKKRRSYFPKFYTGEKVSDLIVVQMLENATLAPTHKLTEPWRFIVFTGEGIKKFAASQAEIYKSVTGKNGTFKEDKYQSLLAKPLLSSHIIAVCMKRDEMKSIPEIEEVGAVFCAVENMYLTATAYGVGCYLSTGGVTYFEEAKSLFGLGAEDKIIGFMHVGISSQNLPDAVRKPIEGIVDWVS
jgi:nitroreductase